MIDPSSANYQSYITECRELGKWHMEEWEKIGELRKAEQFRGKDDPSVIRLHREYSRRLKELQIKYGYREKLP